MPQDLPNDAVPPDATPLSAGLTEAEIAAQIGILHASVERTWAFARAWLLAAVRREIDPPATTMRDSPP